MKKLTENFVDQVLYFKSLSLAAKGGGHLTPLLLELLHFRYMHKGETALELVEYYVQLHRQSSAYEVFRQKLAELAERDGWDSEVGVDGLEALSDYMDARYG